MLALFLLFSETATAFAGEVSNNGAVPFEFVEEEKGDVSENSEALISENESQEEVVESEVNEFNDGENKIVAMELISEPTENRYYAYFSKKANLRTPYGIEVKVTYENGEVMLLEYGDLIAGNGPVLNEGLKNDKDQWVDDVSTNGIFEGYPAGKYRHVYSAKNNRDVTFEFDVIVKSWESIPKLELDDTVSMKATNEWYVSETLTTIGEKYGDALYSMTLEAGDYKISSSEKIKIDNLYDSKGNVVSVEDRLTPSLEKYFTVSAGTYYIVLGSAEDTEITLSKDNKPKSLEVVSEPEKDSFVYGIEHPSLEGLKIKIKYDDGTESKAYAVSSLEAIGIFSFYIFNEDDTKAQYVDGRLAPGKYYYKVFPDADPSLYKIYDFTVKELNAPNVSLGQKVNLKKTARVVEDDSLVYPSLYDEEGKPYDPEFYSINLTENESYLFSFDSDFVSYVIYGPDYKPVTTTNLYDEKFDYTPTKTGTYYLQINSCSGKFCVATPEAITEVKILSPQHHSVTYARAEYDEKSDPLYFVLTGMRVRMVNAKGESLECSAYDDTWKAKGIGIEWLYDVSGNKVSELEENEDYYLKLKVPGFEGEAIGAELLKIKALPIEDLTITKGEKYYLPLYKYGHISGSTEYFADVKAGKFYRFKSNSGSKIMLCDSGNLVAGSEVISKDGGSVYKAEKDGRLYFDVTDEFLKDTDYSAEIPSPWIMYEEVEKGVYEADAKKIIGLEIIKAPMDGTFYEYYSKEFSPAGIELKITYGNGTEYIATDVIDIQNHGVKDLSLGDKDLNQVQRTATNGVFTGYAAGNYKHVYAVFSPKYIKCGYDVSINSWDDISELPLNESVLVKSNVYKKTVNGSINMTAYGDNLYKVTLEKGDYLLTSVDEGYGLSVPEMYDSKGNKVTPDGLKFNTYLKSHSFTVDKADTYYIEFNVTEDATVTLVKDTALKPKEIEVISGPDQSSFLYGFESPYAGGIKVNVKYKDGSSTGELLYNSAKFNELFYLTICTEDGKSAWSIRDKYDKYPPGKYVFRIVLRDKPELYKDFPFTIRALESPDLAVGGKVSLSKNYRKYTDEHGSISYTPFDENGKLMAQKYVSVNLIEKESYHFSFDAESIQASLYDEAFKAIGETIYSKEFDFTPVKTGKYYVAIYSTGGEVSLVKNPATITAVTVLHPQNQELTHAGMRDNNDWLLISSSGIKIHIEYSNGDVIECEEGDEIWDSLGVTVDYPYDASGVKITELVMENGNGYHRSELQADTYYYIKLTVPGYSGEVANEDLLKFKAVSKAELTLKAGEKYKIPVDDKGQLIEAQVYFVNLEKGKTYRFTTNIRAISIFDGLDLVGSVLKEQALGLVYTATEDKSLTLSLADALVRNLDYSGKEPYMLYEETEGPKSIVVKEAPSKLSYVYGVYSPEPENVTINVTYDSEVTTVSYDIFVYHRVKWKLFSAEGVEAVKDEKGNYPVGTYFYGYTIDGLNAWYYDTANKVEIIAAPAEYTVTFESNYPVADAQNVNATQALKYNTKMELAANTFACEGYSFAGWALSADGEVEYADKESVLNIAGEAESITLYAKWTLNGYRIRWHLAGASFVDPDSIPTSYTVNSETILVPGKEAVDTVSEHFAFDGWYEDVDYTKPATGIEKGSVGDRDFFLRIKPDCYTIRYFGNGNKGGGMMQDLVVYYGVDATLAKVGFKDSRAFLGWALSASGEPEIKDGSTIDISKYADKLNEEDRTLTLYAVWKNDFTIHYETNGGTLFGDYPSSYTFGSKFNLPKPSRTGYTFAGWYKEAELKTKIDKIAKTTSGDLVLNAKWTPVKYTVKLDANGGTGKMKNLTFTYDVAASAPECKYTKKGYTFKGWTVAANKSAAAAFESEEVFDAWKLGNTFYASGDELLNLATTKQTVVLAAVWVRETYRAEFETFGGTDIAPIDYFYNKSGNSFELPANPSKDGYAFVGWYSDEKFSKKVTNTKGFCGNMTIYAKWKADYTIEFNKSAEDATGTMNPQKMVYGTSKALTKNAFKRTGYVFMGWDTDSKAQTVVYTDKQKIIGEIDVSTLVLYAVWRKEFTITYVTNGGAEEGGSPTGYSYGEGVTLKKAVRHGYTFVGWYSDAKHKKKVTRISKTASGDKTFYAKWKGRKYTVAFNALAPAGTKFTGKTKGFTAEYGKSKALTKNGFKIKGYTFKGWAVKPGGPVVYANGEKLTEANMGGYAQGINLYAVWEKNCYCVTYKMGGILPDEVVEGAYDVDSGYTLEEPSRIGYTFLGFYTDKKCKKKAKDLAPGSTGNKTFYAKWKANK